jgi:hypothetical protein
LLFPFLQADVVDISSGEEPAHQKDPTPETQEDPLTMVNALVNLQDPILKTPENPATPVDASVGLQGLQEPIVAASNVGPSLQQPIVTSSAISPPPERARLQQLIVASSAITPPLERVRPQEPIITSSAVTPPPERVCLQELIVTSPVITLLSGSNLSELLSFDPASVGSAILEVNDHQQDPTSVTSQLLRVKGLLCNTLR